MTAVIFRAVIITLKFTTWKLRLKKRVVTYRKSLTVYKELMHTPDTFGKDPHEMHSSNHKLWVRTKLMLMYPSYYPSFYTRESLNLLISGTYSSLRELSKDIRRILKD